MHRRLILAGLAATGGLVTTAFLQAAVAAADVTGADPSATGADAFTIGGFTFDPTVVTTSFPGVEGFDPALPLTAAPPLLQLAGGDPEGLDFDNQTFAVFAPSTGTDLGNISTAEDTTNLLGLTNSSFTVQQDLPADGVSASDLPTVGSVYDALNLGGGFENIYTAIPGTAGGADTVTDTLVTPFGNVNLDSLFGSIDAAAGLNPGDALTPLEAGDSGLGPDAFTIGGFTLEPLTGANASDFGFAPIPLLFASPPLLDIAGGDLLGIPFASQQFDVFNSSGTIIGTTNLGENVTDLLGLTNTELIADPTFADPTASDTGPGLPTEGSVFDAFNLGNGYENVYTDIPSTTGGADTVTDTLITPFGNINLDPLFGNTDVSAAVGIVGLTGAALNPGDAFTGLQAGDSSIGADAFSLGGFTFDPTTFDTSETPTEGFSPASGLFAAPPLLELAGGEEQLAGLTGPLDPQEFNVFDGTGASATEVGTIQTAVNVTDLLGFTNTEFTVGNFFGENSGPLAAVNPDADASASDLPTVGSVFDAMNFGGGIENVYTAIPGVDGAADTVTDTLVTPLGNINLDPLFAGIDAAMPLDPGDAFTAGLDVASAAVSTIDPLSFLGL
jgi:hypothetical protein